MSLILDQLVLELTAVTSDVPNMTKGSDVTMICVKCIYSYLSFYSLTMFDVFTVDNLVSIE